MTMEPLPFRASHWDYLPVEIQEHILDLAAKSLHRSRMWHVCISIQRHVQWLDGRFCKKIFSQRCMKCYKLFSPELSLSRHRAICEGIQTRKEFEKCWKQRRRRSNL